MQIRLVVFDEFQVERCDKRPIVSAAINHRVPHFQLGVGVSPVESVAMESGNFF